MKINLAERNRVYVPGDDPKSGTRGELEFIIKDRNGNVIETIRDHNIVKIFAKEMLAHRLPSSEKWDINANGGTGGWVSTGIDADEEFAARYIIFGASFDENGLPLDSDDDRYYTTDPTTGSTVPIRLGPGAEYEGGLINPILISEPSRPLKRVEEIDFEATYQPAGTPLLQEDVRAINNIVKLQTTLQLEEYNGMGVTDSDFFTITEVALVGGRKINAVETCDCSPRDLFLEGTGSSNAALSCIANGTDVISIDPTETDVDLIKEGDQIKIVADGSGTTSLNQTNPFYFALSKSVGGRDIQLDRTLVDSSNTPITGSIGVYRDTMRIFSHRILNSPFKKSSNFVIEVRWSIVMS
jgi:hypothetical protein